MNFFRHLFKKKKKILIIEDDVNVSEMVTHLLGSADYKVYKATNGKEGLSQAYRLKPNLILLDIGLPDIDGWQILKTLKVAPQTKTIPIVILTVLNEMANISKAFQMGAQGYLPKPLNSEALLKKINEIFPA